MDNPKQLTKEDLKFLLKTFFMASYAVYGKANEEAPIVKKLVALISRSET